MSEKMFNGIIPQDEVQKGEDLTGEIMADSNMQKAHQELESTTLMPEN